MPLLHRNPPPAQTTPTSPNSNPKPAVPTPIIILVVNVLVFALLGLVYFAYRVFSRRKGGGGKVEGEGGQVQRVPKRKGRREVPLQVRAGFGHARGDVGRAGGRLERGREGGNGGDY